MLGIDQYGPVESNNYYRNKGSADSVMLLVFDETNKACTVLYLNRDTMLNMDAIPILNDAVGGVTVNVIDDFSQVNPSITMGELTLLGDQVIDYVRTRKDVGDQKNVTRMERQKEYVDGFLKALMAKEQEDLEFAVSLYEQVAPYVITDCSVNTLSGMLNRYAEFSLVDPCGRKYH